MSRRSLRRHRASSSGLLIGLALLAAPRPCAQEAPAIRYEVQLKILDDRIEGFTRITFPTDLIPEGIDRIPFTGQIRRYGWNGIDQDPSRFVTDDGIFWPQQNLAASDDLNRAELWFTLDLARPNGGFVVTRASNGTLSGVHSVQWPGFRQRLWPCFDDPSVPSICELEVLAPADWLVRASTEETGLNDRISDGRDRNDGLLTHRFQPSASGPLDAFGFVAARLIEVTTDIGREVRVFGPPGAGPPMSVFTRALTWLRESRRLLAEDGFTPDPSLDAIWLPGCDERAAQAVGLYVVSDPIGNPPTRLEGMRAWLESTVRPPLPAAERGPWLGLREWICREALAAEGEDAGVSIRRDLYRSPSLALRWAGEWNAVRARTGPKRFLDGVRSWLATRENTADERELAKIIDAELPDPFRARTKIDWSPGGDPPDEVVVEAFFTEAGAKGNRPRQLLVIEKEREVRLDVQQRGARSEIGRLRGREAPLAVLPVQSLNPGLPVGLSASAWSRVANLPAERLAKLDGAQLWTTGRASWSLGVLPAQDLLRFGERLVVVAPVEELGWLSRELLGLALTIGEDAERARLATALEQRMTAEPATKTTLAPLVQLVRTGSAPEVKPQPGELETQIPALRALGSTLDPRRRQQAWNELIDRCANEEPWRLGDIAAATRSLAIPSDRTFLTQRLAARPQLPEELVAILRLASTVWQR